MCRKPISQYPGLATSLWILDLDPDPVYRILDPVHWIMDSDTGFTASPRFPGHSPTLGSNRVVLRALTALRLRPRLPLIILLCALQYLVTRTVKNAS